MLKGLISRSVTGTVALALAVTVVAQDPKVPPGGRGAATATQARKLAVTGQVRSAAAAAQLASIRLSLGQLLVDAMTRSAEDASSSDLGDFREDEILRAIAAQLETFIKAYDGTDEAEAARALLARVYVNLRQPGDAARVLKNFDASRAGESELLKVAMAMSAFSDLAVSADEWLAIVAGSDEPCADRMDAVFVAYQLGKQDLADQLLQTIRKKAVTPVAKADLLVAEAELIRWIQGQKSLTAADEPTPSDEQVAADRFQSDPVADAQLRRRAAPVGTWRQVAAPTDAAVRPAVAVAKPLPPLIDSDLYFQVITDATLGLRSLQLRQPITKKPILNDDRYVPPMPGAKPLAAPPADVLIAALLHQVVTYYPGTPGAEIAAAKLQSADLQIGDKPLPVFGVALQGKPVTLSDYQGKVLLLDFFAANNRVSTADLPVLKQLHQDWYDAGFDILSVSLDSDADRWLLMAMADAMGMDWKVLFDGMGVHTDMARRYDVDHVPARLVIGRDGNIFEDRAWKLGVDALPGTIAAALRQPAPAKGSVDPILVIDDYGDYHGAPIDAKLQVDPDTGDVVVAADMWVVDVVTDILVDHVDADGDVISIYLTVTQPAAENVAPSGLYLKQVAVPIKNTTTKTICIFVDPRTLGMAKLPAAKPALLDVICVDGFVAPYTGPKVDALLVSTDSLPPEFTVALGFKVPTGNHVVKTTEIVRGPKVTQILLTMVGTKPVEGDEPTIVKHFVPLGSEVAGTIEVLVDYRLGTDNSKPANFVLATSLSSK